MWKEEMHYDKVFKDVKVKRSIANPNIGFTCQLYQWWTRRIENKASLFRIAPQCSSAPDYLVPKHVTIEKLTTLDPRGVCVLREGMHIFLWVGKSAPDDFVRAGYKFADQLRKYEMMNVAERTQIFKEEQGNESDAFWSSLEITGKPKEGQPPNSFQVATCSEYDADFDIWRRGSFSAKTSDMLSSDRLDSARSGRKTPRTEGHQGALSPNDRFRKQARSQIHETENKGRDVSIHGSSLDDGSPLTSTKRREGPETKHLTGRDGSGSFKHTCSKSPSLNLNTKFRESISSPSMTSREGDEDKSTSSCSTVSTDFHSSEGEDEDRLADVQEESPCSNRKLRRSGVPKLNLG